MGDDTPEKVQGFTSGMKQQIETDRCSPEAWSRHPELTTGHQALDSPTLPHTPGLGEQEWKPLFYVWCFEHYYFFDQAIESHGQKLKQYK